MQKPHLKFEEEHWGQGLLICGVDEVGRGCLAGPVVAAAVVLPKNHKRIPMVRDSKTLSEKQRRELFDLIIVQAEDFGVGLVPATEIDLMGIHIASRVAMNQAVSQIVAPFSKVIVDGNAKIENLPHEQEAVVSADAICYSVSCASILAKVFRDQVVAGFDNLYPEFGFSSHKGYSTKKHKEALGMYGPTPEHRKTFLRKIMK